MVVLISNNTQQFSIKEIVSRNEDTILAWVNCTRFDAYYIAYQLAPLAKIIKLSIYDSGAIIFAKGAS
jgi:hypothetical protein